MAASSETPAETLRRLVNLLQHHCLLGQLHYRAWKSLNDSFGKTPTIGNLAPIFFLYSADAHLNSALLILNRLIDKRRDALTLRRFLDRVSADATHFANATPGVVREAVEKDRGLLEEWETTAGKIRDHRNTQFMHLSERLLHPPFGVIPAEDSFAYLDIGRMLVDAGHLLNRYSVFLSGTEMLMQVWGEEAELPYLTRLLDRGYQALDEEQASGL